MIVLAEGRFIRDANPRKYAGELRAHGVRIPLSGVGEVQAGGVRPTITVAGKAVNGTDEQAYANASGYFAKPGQLHFDLHE
ncbi:hypothetical protein [Nonomuraea sp. NEAU-A123]|uniref:hypothetical protein n=1 Tax=Nonomuraea sp. NEAU-A123 TaxID=2839649 RepID=UPI001BE43B19|nr:hypothetical protein [Nonomuraea sp. NEAU-A123]MBT2230044.1 hypothetical protein [Nonomuraea sp. NEAU-A123]MBT2230686.1 hypothetical protein [Nonomuraea sp. NEAU-A123]